MTNNPIESNGLHPTIGELLLYVDNEMEPDRAGAVKAHLAACPDCTQARDGIGQGIATLRAFKDSARLPVPPISMAVLESRLLDGLVNAREPRRSLLLRLFAPFARRRIAFAGAFTVLLVIFGLLFQPSPQVAKASQLLTRSIAAADSARNARKTIRQTVRFRQGNRVFEKSVFRGRQSHAPEAQEADAALGGILVRASVDWNDPLNPRDFARWREAQPARSDMISESPETITIITSTKDSTIAGGSLTLARSDWRPVARRIDLRAEPAVEISEVGYELIDTDSLTGTVRPSGTGVAMAPPAGTVSASQLPSASELEASELRLREILAFLGLDTTAAPTIWRTTDKVHFRIYPESPEDAEKLRAAAKDIPFVVEGGENPAQGSDDVNAPVTQEFESTAPFARILERRLGGLEQMNAYLTGVQDQYARTLAQSTAVSGLAIRYPAGYPMPDSLEERLERLVGDHVAAQKSELASYLQSLDSGLDGIRPGNAAGAREPAKGGVCSPWQEPSRLIAPELRELNIAFLRLFISEKAAAPTEQAPAILLAECERLKALLEQHLAALCAPLGR
jgi:anti-sigma factor RsiW